MKKIYPSQIHTKKTTQHSQVLSCIAFPKSAPSISSSNRASFSFATTVRFDPSRRWIRNLISYLYPYIHISHQNEGLLEIAPSSNATSVYHEGRCSWTCGICAFHGKSRQSIIYFPKVHLNWLLWLLAWPHFRLYFWPLAQWYQPGQRGWNWWLCVEHWSKRLMDRNTARRCI